MKEFHINNTSRIRQADFNLIKDPAYYPFLRNQLHLAYKHCSHNEAVRCTRKIAEELSGDEQINGMWFPRTNMVTDPELEAARPRDKTLPYQLHSLMFEDSKDKDRALEICVTMKLAINLDE